MPGENGAGTSKRRKLDCDRCRLRSLEGALMSTDRTHAGGQKKKGARHLGWHLICSTRELAYDLKMKSKPE